MLKYDLGMKQLVCLIMSLTMLSTVSAKTDEHAKHGHQEAMAKECKEIAAIPSLRCALAPSATFDQKGRAWVVWVYAGHVYLSASVDNGQTFTAPNTVNRTPENIYAKGENRPKIAFGPKGEIYISWTQKLTEKRFSGHIRFTRSLVGGKHFSDPVTVNDHREVTSHRFDALAVNQQGDIYLAWLDKRDLLAAKKQGKKYNGAAVYYALSTDGGKTFHKNKKIAGSSCECCRVAMAMDNDQLPVIVWRHIFDDNIRDHGIVKFIQRDQAGTPIRLSHDNWKVEGCPHHGPSISIANDGIYHTTWFNNAAKSHGLFYAYSTDMGQSFSTPLNFGDYEKSAAHPDVLSLGQRVFIVWKEFDGKQSSLYLMVSENGGKSWSSPKQLATTSAGSDHPFLLSDHKHLYVSWHRSGEAYSLLPVADK
jgi:hypothetical protein